MMFCRAGHISGWVAAATIAVAGIFLPADVDAGMGYAVVPTTIIYPGDTLSASQLQEVEVTNPERHSIARRPRARALKSSPCPWCRWTNISANTTR